MSVLIRPATAPDCVAVADIYRHYVENTVITFDYDSPSAADWKAKRADLNAQRMPFVVASDETGAVVGFAYVAQYRVKQAYAWTVENTIYLSPDHTGKGYGTALMNGLLDAVRSTSIRRIVAVIADVPGTGSIALHTKAGFYDVGRLRRIGYKHGAWVDCMQMQLDVNESDDPPT
ncbi:GNAT family N-acetyltransferase [Williamsia muralis]|uniref:N-acetyltransferase family protein n=1 Tax=Williamsia marianensis TaxID=85044 RepID=A0ABU4ESP3_WILMA|nr:GNAT family N-acetyltransferase [Williamsia muralis]MDV7134253.1 N-acetyltransferase family protein [Williamsia muralis]